MQLAGALPHLVATVYYTEAPGLQTIL